MRILYFILSLTITTILAYFLSVSIQIKPGVALPPLGSFFCPFTGFWQNAESQKLNLEKKLHLKGVYKPVEIKMDDRMVPHISAQNQHDLIFAQGYITAANRLWEMDIASRSASGRLSEVIGRKTIEIDRKTRRKGLMLAAENATKIWLTNKNVAELMNAYVDGVNAYIDQLSAKDYPIEFKLLDYKPEKWTPVNIALLVSSMAQTLASKEYDLEYTNSLKLFGKEDFEILYPEQNPNQTPIMPPGTKWDYIKGLTEVTSQIKNAVMGSLYPFPTEINDDPHIGSNNWVVGPSKTAGKAPILCNDPHLNLTLPSIWYEVQLTAPGMNAYGASLPGAPGIIIGFNENVAWGVTNAEWDVLDWYNVKWTDNTQRSYLLDGKKQDVTYRIETIGVKDSVSYIDTVKYTKWGPVVYEDPKSPSYGLAMKWLIHSESSPTELETFLNLDAAASYDDYYNATNKYIKPAQNIVFAANNGDIALRILGRMPKRNKGEGKFIMDGSISSNGWTTTWPNENNPIVKNPEQGYLTSSNQNTTAADYPLYYIGNFDDFRGRYINRRLASMDSVTVEDMMKLQNDPYSILAEEGLSALLNRLDTNRLNDEERLVYDSLKRWKYNFKAESKASSYFTIWWEEFRKQTWDEMYSIIDSIPVMIPENWRTIELLNTNPSYKFFDSKTTTKIESAKDIVLTSFREMMAQFELFASNPSNEKGNWWAYRNTVVEHIGKIPAFSSKRVKTDGFKDAINAVTTKTGPSWRMIVELSKPVKAWGIYPGGQSGNPGSKYYDNMIEKWSKGQYDELVFLTKENNDNDRIISTIHISK